MKITTRQLRKIIKEVLLYEKFKGGFGSEEEIPEKIQKKVDKMEAMGMPAKAVYEDGKWVVKELQ